MHVIMDIVLNHAGDVFAYVLDNGSEAASAAWRDNGYSIRWRGADNRPVAEWSEAPQSADPKLTSAAAVWPNEIRSNQTFRRKGKGGEDGGDFESLKEFVSAHPEVRSALIRCYQHAIAKWDIDGFRIDTLKYIEPDFALVFGNAIREYALEIGKTNFFTFGEVYDDEYKIAKFIGRRSNDDGDMVGVDAALDFPLFFRLPGVAKGLVPPTELTAVYALRKSVEQGVISSHGEAGRFFVTFLDNHDQHNRFRFVDTADPGRYDGQVSAALACLFSLQGIPCVYYGTEQGLHGTGSSDQDVREALGGRPSAFDETDKFYLVLRDIARVRAQNPALRYGRQYFRPVSGDRRTFGASSFAPGVVAVSRILNESETVVIANMNIGPASSSRSSWMRSFLPPAVTRSARSSRSSMQKSTITGRRVAPFMRSGWRSRPGKLEYSPVPGSRPLSRDFPGFEPPARETAPGSSPSPNTRRGRPIPCRREWLC
jgi:glycosidase